jgi:hypothetical protein
MPRSGQYIANTEAKLVKLGTHPVTGEMVVQAAGAQLSLHVHLEI